jgi:hypothetical protein
VEIPATAPVPVPVLEELVASFAFAFAFAFVMPFGVTWNLHLPHLPHQVTTLHLHLHLHFHQEEDFVGLVAIYYSTVVASTSPWPVFVVVKVTAVAAAAVVAAVAAVAAAVVAAAVVAFARRQASRVSFANTTKENVSICIYIYIYIDILITHLICQLLLEGEIGSLLVRHHGLLSLQPLLRCHLGELSLQ